MLLVSGKPPLADPSLLEVLATIESVQQRMPCTIRLLVSVKETSKRLEMRVTLSAAGLSCVVQSPTGSLSAFRRDEIPLTATDVRQLFETFYDDGQRSLEFHWTL
tara:strand:+ start:55927 stop:56241 length:315 start_codon:yes stop_codon:yes gene_type:complete